MSIIPVNATDNINKSSSDTQISISPLNPDFVQYQEDLDQSKASTNTVFTSNKVLSGKSYEDISSENMDRMLDENEVTDPSLHSPGLMPSPIDFSYISPVNTKDLLADEKYATLSFSASGSVTYPSRYDLRKEGGVTPIRDQALAGSCWSFASYGTLESYLIHNKSENWDFSEQHVKNTLVSSSPNGFDRSEHDDGGTTLMALAYLARWDGPVTESDDHYASLSSESSADVVVAKHVQDAFIFPQINHTNDLFKQMIMDYGGISVAIHDDQSAYFNAENNAYYCYEEDKMLTHAITLVGWDDNFNKTKFTPAAPADGAYIIKNSWGNNWAEDGYYYVSYYDKSIGNKDQMNGSESYTTNYVIMAENVSNYDHIYQYDLLGWCSNTGFNNSTALGANVFTATANQTLEAVSFYTVDSNSYYNISVYLDPENGPVNSSGPVAVTNGTIALAGYHTIDLDHNVSLPAGQNFSIVINFTTPEYTYPVAIEKVIDRHSSNANAESGQSYLSSNGSNWTDISASDMNVCIKAFTTESRQPQSNFVADKRYVHINQSVKFHDASLYSPQLWQWDFGDGNTSTQQNPTYSYASPGIYNVSLNVSNEFGSNVTVRDTFIHVLNSTITVNSSGGADFKLIQMAVDAAYPGDAIIVEPGNYTERVSFRKDNLTLKSSTGNPEDVRITSPYPYSKFSNVYNNAVFIMADNITLQDINVTGGFYGFLASSSNNCTIINCTFTDNGLGMVLDLSSNNNQIINCTFEKNIAGLVLSNSADNYLANNSINNNLLYTFDMDSNPNYVDTSNTVDGKPIYSLVGKSDIVIDSDSNAALVHLVDCTNITIEDLECRNQRHGIYLYNTTDTCIRNYTSIQNLYGIYLGRSRDNILSNSTVNDSNKIGIYITDSVDNLIYNNYFNNTNNIHISAGTFNEWNITKTAGRNTINGSYLGGNFWAEPDGTGWSQVEYSIVDGFCQPYNITDDGNNTDCLPLTANAEKPSEPKEQEVQPSDNDGVRVQKAAGTAYSSSTVEQDIDTRFVGIDAEVRYTFNEDSTPVTEIRFNAGKNEGYVMASVSLLDAVPVDMDGPAGKSYMIMDINMGSEDLFSEDNATIEFQVSKEWVDENNIDPSTIRMTRFHDGQWQDLPGNQVEEDDEYLYFNARTSGFSVFSIVGDEREVIEEPIAEENDVEEVVDKPEAETEDDNAQVPGFSAIFAVALTASAAFAMRKKE
ncbi:lectin like domain-containing protein [Methanohalophilus halophilus]|nr:lectin like domain-containing protein [Methanohalophilus halophilus]